MSQNWFLNFPKAWLSSGIIPMQTSCHLTTMGEDFPIEESRQACTVSGSFHRKLCRMSCIWNNDLERCICVTAGS